MRYSLLLFIGYLLVSCSGNEQAPFTSVKIEPLYQDTMSVRAIELMGNNLAFAGSNGMFGSIDLETGKVRSNIEKYHTSIPAFRSVGHTTTDFFMLSIGNPALLYKTGDQGRMELVYMEEGEGVFYDAMTFLNGQEGIAVGDATKGCLSILMTKDGGNSWKRIPCEELPKAIDGEGAFAASNTNIKTIGDHIWIATTKRVLHSSDKGSTWETSEPPIDINKPTSGVYSIDFYDQDIGVVFGGDYTDPLASRNNKALTKDGGKNWYTIADGNDPGYRSCVQFVPNSEGNALVVVGFKGIDYSSDQGASWKQLSNESFYTIRFLNDSVAYAAGKNRIAKLTFKRN